MNIVFYGVGKIVEEYFREAAGSDVSIGAGGSHVAVVCDDYPTVEQTARKEDVIFVVVLTDSDDGLHRWLLETKIAGKAYIIQPVPKSVRHTRFLLDEIRRCVN